MVDSCLIEGRKGMDRAVLEVVASTAVATKHDVKRYVQCTLLAATKDFQVCHLPCSPFCSPTNSFLIPCICILVQMFYSMPHLNYLLLKSVHHLRTAVGFLSPFYLGVLICRGGSTSPHAIKVLTGRMCRHVQEVVTKAATDALRSLQERRLITWEKSSGLWGPTLLGSAVVASSLDIQDALDYKQVWLEMHQCSYCKP